MDFLTPNQLIMTNAIIKYPIKLIMRKRNYLRHQIVNRLRNPKAKLFIAKLYVMLVLFISTLTIGLASTRISRFSI